MSSPVLVRRVATGLAWHADPSLVERHGIVVAFTERSGGVSVPPYASLNLAGHVCDDPAAVDGNRSLLLDALGLASVRGRLTTAEQVHGDRTAEVTEAESGSGAYVSGRPPVPGADALLTALTATPLMLCFADCVPVVLVATSPVRAVAVVHTGWRGALSRLPAKAALALAARAGCETSSLLAYVGAHICEECYEVGEDLRCRFEAEFGTIRSAQGRLDLGAVVSGSLRDAGVPEERLARLGSCTVRETERFFSYRAEGVTGRHGALAVVLQGRG